MVAVKPVDDIELIKKLYAEHNIEFNEYSNAVSAVENGEMVGSGLFTLIDGVLTLLSVKYPKNDLFVCDLISRGVMNYGVNRGVLYCELGENAPFAEFVAFGFIKSKEETSVNIIRTFTQCTHCNKSKS